MMEIMNGSNLVSSNTRWKWCQGHARSINVSNPGSFTKRKKYRQLNGAHQNIKKKIKI